MITNQTSIPNFCCQALALGGTLITSLQTFRSSATMGLVLGGILRQAT